MTSRSNFESKHEWKEDQTIAHCVTALMQISEMLTQLDEKWRRTATSIFNTESLKIAGSIKTYD